jgi:hypothetical protein
MFENHYDAYTLYGHECVLIWNIWKINLRHCLKWKENGHIWKGKGNMFEIIKKAHILERCLQESDTITSLIIYEGN